MKIPKVKRSVFLVLFIIALIIISSLYLNDTLELSGGDTHTIETKSLSYEYYNKLANGGNGGTLMARGYSSEELIDESYIVTSWSDDETSQSVHVSDTNKHGSKPTAADYGTSPWEYVIPILSRYWWHIEMLKPNGVWETLADYSGNKKENVLILEQGDLGLQLWSAHPNNPVDINRLFGRKLNVCYNDGYLDVDVDGNTLPDTIYYRDTGSAYGTIIETWYEDGDESGEKIITASPISFKIKGTYNTWIRVTLKSYFWWFTNCDWFIPGVEPMGVCQYSKTKLLNWVTDETRLVSGEASIGFEKDMYEEKDTITLNVVTGYATYPQTTNKWRVIISDPSGTPSTLRFTLPDGSVHNDGDFLIGDNTDGSITFVVPEGTIESNNWPDNKWTAKIINTILLRDEDYADVLIIGKLGSGPYPPTVTAPEELPSSNKIQISVVAEARSTSDGGTGEISYFRITCKKLTGIGGEIFYPTTSDPEYITAEFQGGNKYGTSIEVTYPFSENYNIEISAQALDKDMIPSTKTNNIKSYGPDSDTYAVNFLVSMSGQPLKGAVIEVAGKFLITESDGLASTSLPKDLAYSAEVSYRSETKTVKFSLDKNGKLVQVDFGLFSSDMILALGIIAVVMLIVSLIAIIVPLHIAYRMMIIVVGIVISLLIYLLMMGYLGV